MPSVEVMTYGNAAACKAITRHQLKCLDKIRWSARLITVASGCLEWLLVFTASSLKDQHLCRSRSGGIILYLSRLYRCHQYNPERADPGQSICMDVMSASRRHEQISSSSLWIHVSLPYWSTEDLRWHVRDMKRKVPRGNSSSSQWSKGVLLNNTTWWWQMVAVLFKIQEIPSFAYFAAFLLRLLLSCHNKQPHMNDCITRTT